MNLKENKLIAKRRGGYLMDDMELVGLDYLWRVQFSFNLLYRPGHRYLYLDHDNAARHNAIIKFRGSCMRSS